MKTLLILAAALAAFAAGWLGRGLVPDRAEPVGRAPALASVVPVGVYARSGAAPEPAPHATADPSPREPFAPFGEAPPAAGGRPDSVGVLLARHFDKTAPRPTVSDYYLYLPPGIEEERRSWPVILYLHGRSLRGSDLTMLRRYGLPRYLADGRALPFIVVAPQLPDGQSWTDVERLAEILEKVLDRYPADRDRVYVTGYSMGGGGAWRMALAYPQLFAAAAPMAANWPEPSSEWTRALAHLPMRVFHGTADEAVPFAPARTMVDALRGAGLDVELQAVQGAGHGDLTTIYGQPGLYDWFLAHRRSAQD
jgi:predicted esterase